MSARFCALEKKKKWTTIFIMWLHPAVEIKSVLILKCITCALGPHWSNYKKKWLGIGGYTVYRYIFKSTCEMSRGAMWLSLWCALKTSQRREQSRWMWRESKKQTWRFEMQTDAILQNLKRKLKPMEQKRARCTGGLRSWDSTDCILHLTLG